MNKCPLLKQVLITGGLLFLFLGIAAAKPFWLSEGQIIRCSVTRDTGISSTGDEKTGNSGEAGKLKLKGQQEYILLDIDPAPLKGKIVKAALLHIRSASPEKARLARVGISTLASEWIEGSSRWYWSQAGSSCYAQAAYQTREWAYPGSTLMDVVFGRGHTLWKFADCSPPDPDGWQTCAVDADVVAARAAGLSHGFCLYDEVGSEWSLRNGQFEFIYFPNRLCYSQESWGSDPWLEIWVSGTDTIPPEPVKSIEVDIDGFHAGEALIRWHTPDDDGAGKTLGFQVTYQRKGKQERAIPRYLIPMAGKPGEEVRMYIQDLPFNPGETISLTIRPVDSAGNVGKPFTKNIRLSPGSEMPNVPESDIHPFPSDTDIPEVGGLRVAVVDLVDKINPKTGQMIPSREKGYKSGNHIFSAKQKQIRVYAARNETVAFQINLAGIKTDISVSCQFDQHPAINSKLYQFGYVNVMDKHGKVVSVLPDPLISIKSEILNSARSSNLSLICEFYIPHGVPSGKKKGKLIVSAGKDRLELDIDLTIWNFTLPNKLSFVPEMNAYGTVSPYKGYEYYRLAHEHRTCINRLPYGWNGLPSFAPAWDGDDFDWRKWDQKVGPLLDGSAFDDLPRSHEPVDIFYLPFSENWPVNIFEHYKPSYWADEAFTDQYQEELKKAYAAFAKHCNEKRWHDTIFQFYLNNKIRHRKNFRQSSAPWIFDEPVNTQDFWALRWYGLLWRMAVHPVMGNAKMWYRADISYTQFARDTLRNITDVEYLGGNNAQKTRMKQDEQILWGKSRFSEYGTANKIEESNIQPVLWCLSAWSKGAIGVLPWQTIGGKNCWKTAEQTALFYPHPEGPRPSVRLKAFTRGQQDVEYLTLFCDVYKTPRFAVAKWLGKIIDLKGNIRKSSVGDAGTATYDKGDVVELWKLRYRIGRMLSERGPEYKQALINRDTPQWETKSLPDIGYVPMSPEVEAYKPDCDNFKN